MLSLIRIQARNNPTRLGEKVAGNEADQNSTNTARGPVSEEGRVQNNSHRPESILTMLQIKIVVTT